MEILGQMLESFSQRTVIIGNCGSGKTVLAESLAALANIPAIDLDSLHWESDGHKRDEEAAKRLVCDAAAALRSIMEGVFGWLVEMAMPRATALVWLDLPWRVCREGLLVRGRRDRSEDDFADLLAWSEAYWDRQTSSSFKGHSFLFESFRGIKTAAPRSWRGPPTSYVTYAYVVVSVRRLGARSIRWLNPAVPPGQMRLRVQLVE